MHQRRDGHEISYHHDDQLRWNFGDMAFSRNSAKELYHVTNQPIFIAITST